jgi:flagellar biosynthesis protein FliP
MTVTAFVKIATVLQIVRSAIGAQSVPSSTVIMALAAALTLIAMAPVGDKIIARAAPLFAGKETPDTSRSGARRGIDAVREPMRDFLFEQRRARRERRASSTSRGARGAGGARERRRDDLTVLVPPSS